MEIMRIILKIIMWVLIVGFGCNFVMQTVSYSFYKSAKKMTDITSIHWEANTLIVKAARYTAA